MEFQYKDSTKVNWGFPQCPLTVTGALNRFQTQNSDHMKSLWCLVAKSVWSGIFIPAAGVQFPAGPRNFSSHISRAWLVVLVKSGKTSETSFTTGVSMWWLDSGTELQRWGHNKEFLHSDTIHLRGPYRETFLKTHMEHSRVIPDMPICIGCEYMGCCVRILMRGPYGEKILKTHWGTVGWFLIYPVCESVVSEWWWWLYEWIEEQRLDVPLVLTIITGKPSDRKVS